MPMKQLLEIKQQIETDNSVNSNSDFVYKVLKTAIFGKQLTQGDRLKENEISHLIGVSRTPVREALYRLESQGLVNNQPRAGFVVTELSSEDIIDIYKPREMLDGAAASLAAESATETDKDILESILDEMDKNFDENDSRKLFETNLKFHSMIAKISRNKLLTKMLGDIHDSIRLFKYENTMKKEIIEEHKKIFEAIKNKDGEFAEQVAREHVKSALKRYTRKFKN